MAEAAIGFAASIAGLAAFGIQIVTTLNTFATSYSRAEQQIKDLAANVAITSSILESIGKMIREYEDRFQLTVDNYIATRDQCDRNFQALWVALKVVKKENGMKKIEVKGSWQSWSNQHMRMWDKMIHAMGGADALKDLVLSIETSKSNLQLLLGSLNFLVLKGLSKNNLLTEEQSDDFRLFMRQLPVLVKGLRQAGLMKVDEEQRKSIVSTEPGAVDIHVNATGITKEPPGPALDDPTVDGITTSINDPGDISDISDISDDITKPQEDVSKDTQPHGPNKEIADVHGFVETSSFFTRPPPPPVPRPTFSPLGSSSRRNSTPNVPLDTESLYEAWCLNTDPVEVPEREISAVLCGLRVMKFYAGRRLTSYSIVPLSKDKEILKERANMSKTRRGTSFPNAEDDGKLLESLPNEAREEVKSLLRDRNRRPKKPYGWKIAAIEEQTRKSVFSFGRRKNKSLPRWLIILRGGVIESPVKGSLKRDPNLPSRYDNPWRSRRPGRDEISSYDYYDSNSDSFSPSRRRRRDTGAMAAAVGLAAAAVGTRGSTRERFRSSARSRDKDRVERIVVEERRTNPSRRYTDVDDVPTVVEVIEEHSPYWRPGPTEQQYETHTHSEELSETARERGGEEEETLDEEEAEKLMDEYLATFTKEDMRD